MDKIKQGGNPKVALVNPPQFTKYPQPPMGLALLGAILEREGYRVVVVDGNARRLSLDNILQWAITFGADVVGITAMTPTINSALQIAKSLKHYKPELKIVLGGAHATLLPEETLAIAPEIDVIVKGEGDDAIIDILQRSIIGVYGRQGGFADMDSLPYLAYHLLPWQEYRPHPPHGRVLPFIAMITSRGCPYHCGFCSKAVFGNKFRAQSPKRVVDEVAYYIRRFGVKEIAFYDDVFTLNRKRAYGIADEMLKRGVKVCWTCETRVNLVDRELLSHMKKAGCYSVAYGIESASQEILDVLDKDATVAQAEEAVRLSREVGLQTIGYFMVGSPKETPETIRGTIQLAKRLKLDYAQFAVTTPFPGTKLYDLYLDGKGDANIPWESFVYAGTGKQVAPIFESGLLNRDGVQYWADRAYREFYLRPSYIWQRLSRIRSVGDLKVGIKGLSMLVGNVRK